MVTKRNQNALKGKKMRPVIKAVILNQPKKMTETLEGIFGCPPADI